MKILRNTLALFYGSILGAGIGFQLLNFTVAARTGESIDTVEIVQRLTN